MEARKQNIETEKGGMTKMRQISPNVTSYKTRSGRISSTPDRLGLGLTPTRTTTNSRQDITAPCVSNLHHFSPSTSISKLNLNTSKSDHRKSHSCDSFSLSSRATLIVKPERKDSEGLNSDDDESSNTICSPMEKARDQLHTSNVPETLLGREDECKTIREFIKACIAPDGCSKALYISGVPGTGKTASVNKVINDLKRYKKNNFISVTVNGLEVSDPKRIFCDIYRQVFNISKTKKVSLRSAQHELNQRFEWSKTCGRRPPRHIIILVDEVDALFTKNQCILYTIFNWASNSESRCCVIAISNTLDFSQRCTLRVSSRLGNHSVEFQAYTNQEIQKIIKHRLKSTGASIPDKTIEFSAMKVASVSGDLRKALDLMRRAVDLALEDCEEKGINFYDATLTTNHVLQAIKESMTSIRMDFCLSMVGHEEMMFRALVKDLHSTGLEETAFFALMPRYREECVGQGVDPLTSSMAFHLLLSMSYTHIIVLSPEAAEMNRRVRLGFPLSEGQFCIRRMDEAKKDMIKKS